MIGCREDVAWPLVPFERYMLDDDLPEAPMTFTVTWSIEGSPDAERLRSALERALVSHPLLRCRVERDSWVPAPEGVPFRHLTTAEADALERIDVTRVAALDTALVVNGDAAEFRLTFHHAASDGVGAMEFCGDVFAIYRGDDPADRRADPALLADRRRLERPAKIDATWLAIARHFASEGRRFLADLATAISCEPGGAAPPARSPHPVRFTREETVLLRHRATSLNATLNELLLAVLTSAVGRHCAATAPPRRDAWVGVVQPVSMRPPRKMRLPACNNIGYAFLRRPLADCGDWRSLLPGLVRDTRAVTRLGLAAGFNDALTLICRLPGPLRRRLIRAMRPGTFVFSYLGDPIRRFPRELRRHERDPATPGDDCGLDLGGCRVVDFSAAPPPRRGTELSILASLFGQKLTLWLRPSASLGESASWGNLAGCLETAVRSVVTDPAGEIVRPRHARRTMFVADAD